MKYIATSILFFSVLFSTTALYALQLGAPSVAGMLGQSIMGSLVQDELLRIMNVMPSLDKDKYESESDEGYLKALKKYHKKVNKLMKKHEKKRRKEERIIQGLIDDMARYTPGSPNVNKVQYQKQQKLERKAKEFRENDANRARKLKEYSRKKWPRREDYIKTIIL